jgi:molecular chaperone GrpE
MTDHGAGGAAEPGTDPGSRAAKPAAPAGPDPATGSAGHPDGGNGRAESPESPDSPEETIAELRRQVAELQDQRLRALADADNIRKRSAAQLSQAGAKAAAQVAAQWLPVIDNLDRALEHAGSDPIAEGIRAVRDQALTVLARLGFPRRDDVGTAFDPTRHEAVATRVEPGVPPGTVVEVVRPAYGEGEHQLRPAQVVVARTD